jgi:hypothetical protein
MVRKLTDSVFTQIFQNDTLFTVFTDSVVNRIVNTDSIVRTLTDSVFTQIYQNDTLFSVFTDSIVDRIVRTDSMVRKLTDSVFTQIFQNDTLFTVFTDSVVNRIVNTDSIVRTLTDSVFTQIYQNDTLFSVFTDSIVDRIVRTDSIVRKLTDSVFTQIYQNDTLFTVFTDSIMNRIVNTDSIVSVLTDSVFNQIVNMDTSFTVFTDSVFQKSIVQDSTNLAQLYDSIEYKMFKDGNAGWVVAADGAGGKYFRQLNDTIAVDPGSISLAEGLILVGASNDTAETMQLNAGELLVGDANNDAKAMTISGDVTFNASGESSIEAGTIVDNDINSSAAIAGTKINPDFGGQDLTTTGNIGAGAANISGNITLSGTVDGRDIAADGTDLDDLVTLSGMSANSTTLGSFTGNTIQDDRTIKLALQDLETTVETNSGMGLDGAYSNGPTITTDGDNVTIGGTNALSVTATGGLIANTADINGGALDGLTLGGSSNNNFLDNHSTFQDNGDNSRQMQFELSGITSGETSVITVPDVDGTLLLDNTGLSSLTSAEITQLGNINAHTVSNTQWGYLGSMDQGLSTTSNVGFGSISGTGALAIDGAATLGDATTDQTTLAGNLDVGNGLDLTGNMSVTGTVDGRDIAADGTDLDDLVTLSGMSANSTHLGTFTGSIISDNVTIKEALQDLETSAGSSKQLTDLTDVNTATATSGNLLLGDGTDWESQSITGDVTISGGGVTTIGTDKVTTGHILDGTITNEDLGTNIIESDNITDGTIATDDMAENAVTANKLDTANIPINKLATATDSIDMGNQKVTNMADPENEQDAATKKYVDDQLGAITLDGAIKAKLIYMGEDTSAVGCWRIRIDEGDMSFEVRTAATDQQSDWKRKFKINQ